MNIRSVIIFQKTFLKKKILCVLTFVYLWISSHCPPNINLLFFLGAIRRQPTKQVDVSCLSGKHFGGLVERPFEQRSKNWVSFPSITVAAIASHSFMFSSFLMVRLPPVSPSSCNRFQCICSVLLQELL